MHENFLDIINDTYASRDFFLRNMGVSMSDDRVNTELKKIATRYNHGRARKVSFNDRRHD